MASTRGQIAQYPEFDKRLKQCADRRHQFLDYFTRARSSANVCWPKIVLRCPT